MPGVLHQVPVAVRSGEKAFLQLRIALAEPDEVRRIVLAVAGFLRAGYRPAVPALFQGQDGGYLAAGDAGQRPASST